MKKLLLTLLIVAGCSGATTKVVPDATPTPTVMEMCAEFRNHVCNVVSRCGLSDLDDCTAKLDAKCEEIKVVADPKKLFSECLPQVDQITCDKFDLPVSCYNMFQ